MRRQHVSPQISSTAETMPAPKVASKGLDVGALVTVQAFQVGEVPVTFFTGVPRQGPEVAAAPRHVPTVEVGVG